MDWRIKAAMQVALSQLPAGESMNFVLQRYVTASLPLSPQELGERVARARRHLEAVARHRRGPLAAARGYEFGAGWDLATALALWSLGVEDQVLVHYAYFDRRITVYNFLRYSDHAWRRFNPPLHYQNRLRHRDYLARFVAHGFAVVEAQPAAVDEADLAAVRALPLDPRFADYTADELAIRDARVVLKKATG